jgi:hypothetical protein
MSDEIPTQEYRDAAARVYLREEDWVDADAEPEVSSWDDCLYEVGNNSWLVLTDDEADERCAEYIRESIWAFNKSFVINYVPDGVGYDQLNPLNELYEDANPILLALVGDRFDEFVADAISSDGRGHFLAGYDGEEAEIEVDGFDWFIYRT